MRDRALAALPLLLELLRARGLETDGFAASGRRMFDVDTGATVDSNPALAGDGTLLIGSENGRLYAIR